MRLALQIFSCMCMVIGGLAILGSLATGSVSDVFYSLIGGGLFFTEGLLGILYTRKN